MSDYTKDGVCWQYKYSGDAGDYIYNDQARRIDMNDKSIEANQAFDFCCDLLANGKRWPDHLNQEDTANNFIQWWVSKLLRRLNIKAKKYTRPQKFLTRDPYIAVIACGYHLGRGEEALSLKIPWYCYQHKTWRWRKRLIEDNRPAWRKRMTHYKALTDQISTSDNPNILSNKEDV